MRRTTEKTGCSKNACVMFVGFRADYRKLASAFPHLISFFYRCYVVRINYAWSLRMGPCLTGSSLNELWRGAQ